MFIHGVLLLHPGVNAVKCRASTIVCRLHTIVCTLHAVCRLYASLVWPWLYVMSFITRL